MAHHLLRPPNWISSCEPPKGVGPKPPPQPPHQGGKPPRGEPPHQGEPKRGSKPHCEPPHQGLPHQGDGAKPPQPGKPQGLPPNRISTRVGRRKPPRNCAWAGAARVSARSRVRRERVRRMGIPPQVPG